MCAGRCQHDAARLFFRIPTREPLTAAGDADRMVLRLDTASNARFNYRYAAPSRK